MFGWEAGLFGWAPNCAKGEFCDEDDGVAEYASCGGGTGSEKDGGVTAGDGVAPGACQGGWATAGGGAEPEIGHPAWPGGCGDDGLGADQGAWVTGSGGVEFGVGQGA